MSHKRVRVILLQVTALVITVSVLSIYIMQGQLLSIFRKKLEAKFSDMLGYEVTIGSVSGNVFGRIALRNLRCRVRDYDVSFSAARLEYSLLDFVSGRESLDKEREILINLERGSLRLQNNVIISEEIEGRVRLAEDKVVLESLSFRLFDLLNNEIEGTIITAKRPLRIDLHLEAEPFFDKDKRFFSKARASIKGGVDNLSLCGEIKGVKNLDILLNGYALFSEGVLNLGSTIGLKDLKTAGKNSIVMDTEIDIENSRFDMVLIPDEGRIRITGNYSEWPLLKTDIRNEHIKIYGLDFSNIIHISSKSVFKKGDFSHLSLDIDTESSILNYYPIDEIEASLWIDKDILRLIYLKAGDTISASAALNVKPPRKALLKIAIADFDISQPFLISGEEKAPAVSGRLSGEILIEGQLDSPMTKVSLEAAEGHLGDILYENMIINLKGKGPILEVHDSRLIRRDSFLKLDGRVDMREFGSDRFMEQVKISSDEKTIIWEGWDITKTSDSGELSLSKGLGGGVKIGFKTQMDRDETAYETVKPQNEFQLEYNVPEDNSALQFRAKENEEFLGVMKKYKF